MDRPIGQWLSNLRRPGALDGHSAWEEALREIDPDWNPAWPADWQRHYAALRELVRDEAGQVDVLPGVTVHGMDVGRWLQKNRQHTVRQGFMDR
ncbi:helicase associated domain-containing protein [Streptomyces sp. NPDC051776]|uniref:helicase associated domain-containing protein n=1 Tax=Streptomyces sp. NPDC051776 TaxID=3155414 RepID=UPI003443ECC7